MTSYGIWIQYPLPLPTTHNPTETPLNHFDQSVAPIRSLDFLRYPHVGKEGYFSDFFFFLRVFDDSVLA